MDHRSFLSTRARFQRVNDAKFFSGWVKDFSRSDVVIRLSNLAEVHPGENFMFQINGQSHCAVFKAQLSIVSGDELCFSVADQIKFLSSGEPVRVMVDGITGVLNSDAGEQEILVMDVSANGIGLIAPDPLNKDDEVQLAFETPQGLVTCTGNVRYCRPESTSVGQFRIGIALNTFGRIDQARWNKLMSQDAA